MFYELVCGDNPHAPGPVENYNYLNMSGCTTVPNHDDVEEFTLLHKALLSVGIPADELDDVWAMNAAMLFLGNVKFGDGDVAKVDALGPSDPLRVAEGLLGVEDMSTLLATRQIKVNGETTVATHNPEQAAAARDALVKIMFDRLFTYLVNRINETVDDPAKAVNYIGLLDVYGFEFFEVNSFEQLCINFANEKLQQFFLTTVFASEAAQYSEEGVPWTPIAYADNKDIIDLCENGTNGIYKLLDSQCRAPNTSGKTFCAGLHQAHAKSKVFGAPKLSKKEQRGKDDHFVVKHFAGDVVYFAGEFLAKNNDSLAAEVDEHLLKSKKKVVVDVCKPPEAAAPAGGKAKKESKSSFASVGDKFVKSLKALMSELNNASAHFVRAIKSNPNLRPRELHGELVITQLKMSGTLDAVKLIQAGYPTRIPYDSIHSRYSKVLADVPGIDIASLSPSEFCEAIAEACGVAKSEYALGTTRMFFRMGAAAFLEELAEADPEEMKPKLMEMFAVFEQKRKAKPIMEKTVACWLHKRRYETVVQEKRKKEIELKKKAEELKHKAEEAQRKKEEEERRRKEQEEKRRQEEEAAAAAEKAEAEAAAAAAAAAAEAEAKAKAAEALAAAEAAGDAEAAAALKKEAEEWEAAAAKAAAETAAAQPASTPATEPAAAGAAAAEAQPSGGGGVGGGGGGGGGGGAAAAAAAGGGSAAATGSASAAAATTPAATPAPPTAAAAKAADAANKFGEVEQAMAGMADGDLGKAVEKVGGAEAFVGLAGKGRAGTAATQAQFARLMRDLAVSDEVAIELSNNGGTEALVGAAQKHYDSVEVQVAVAGALRNLSELEEIALDIATSDGLEVLTDAFARHPDSVEVAKAAAGAMWGMSLYDDICELISEMGSHQTLIDAAKKHAGDAEVQVAALGALRNLAVSPEGKQAVADNDGLDVLMAAAGAHLDNALVQAQVAGALRNLSLKDEIAEQIAAEGGIEALIRVARQHPENAKVQAGVAGALRNLTVNDEIAERIVKAGGIEVLIAAGEAHPPHADVQSEVAGALWGLSVSDEIEAKISEAKALSILVGAAKSHLDSTKVLARVAGALRKLSAKNENKQEFAELGGIEVLIKASKIHLMNDVVQAGVAGVLSNLSVDDEIEKMIRDLGGIEMLLSASATHRDNVKVQARVVRALTNLSVHEVNKDAIVAQQGVEKLVDASTAHADSADVQAGVCGALRNLSVSTKVANILVEKNAIPAVIEAAKKHVANPVVLGGAAGMLRNLAAVSAANKQLIIDAGGIDALDTAMMMHPDNERLKNEVTGARRNLLGEAGVPKPEKQDSKRSGDKSDRKGKSTNRSASPSARALKREDSKKGGADAPPLSERKLEPVKEEKKKGTVRASFGGLSRRAKPKK